MKKAFTLIEILVYIGVLAIVIVAVTSFLIWATHSNTKVKAMRETLDNARRAMEIMGYEIKEAKSIYSPTSVFDNSNGQLSLETTHYLPGGETLTYIDFYLCDYHLCLKKESQNPITLTSDRVKVTNLAFSQITTGITPSIQINLSVEYKNPTDRPEYQASVNLKSTISLRNY